MYPVVFLGARTFGPGPSETRQGGCRGCALQRVEGLGMQEQEGLGVYRGYLLGGCIVGNIGKESLYSACII